MRKTHSSCGLASCSAPGPGWIGSSVHLLSRRVSLALPQFAHLRASLLIVSAVAVLPCVTPRAASAGCGDYVLVNGRPLTASRPVATQAAHGAEGAREPVGLPRPPCDGPHCGRQVPLPLPAPSPVPSAAGSDQWCLLFGDAFLPDPLPGRRIPESPVAPRDGYCPPIEHPPRFLRVA
jgi:hypothetical protein